VKNHQARKEIFLNKRITQRFQNIIFKLRHECSKKGSEKMNRKKGSEKMNNGMESVADLLPKLSEEHQELTATEESIAWVWGLLGNYRPGDIHDTGDGVKLQKVTFDTARCIRVFDHPGPMYELSMLQSLFDNAKAKLEIGLCTVITPVSETLVEETKANKATVPEEKKVNEVPSVSKEATKKSDYNYGMEVA